MHTQLECDTNEVIPIQTQTANCFVIVQKTAKKWFIAWHEYTVASLLHSCSMQVQTNEYSLRSHLSLLRRSCARARLDTTIDGNVSRYTLRHEIYGATPVMQTTNGLS